MLPATNVENNGEKTNTALALFSTLIFDYVNFFIMLIYTMDMQ
jgi:hypothetical protein